MTAKGLFGFVLVFGVISYACGWSRGFDDGYDRARKRYLEAVIEQLNIK